MKFDLNIMYDLYIIIPIKCHGSELLIQKMCIECLLHVRYWATVDFVVEENITATFLITMNLLYGAKKNAINLLEKHLPWLEI